MSKLVLIIAASLLHCPWWVENQENLTNKSIYSLVVVDSHMVGGEPKNVTNKSLGLVGGGVGLCGGVESHGGGGEPEKRVTGTRWW